MKTLNVGLIGYGFMGRAHSNAFRKVSNFFDLEYQPILKAICGREEAKVKAFAGKWGYESHETDWHKLLAREDIDLVDIACPNDMHKEIAIAAAKAGKMILCEKPLAMNGAEGLKMVKAVEKSGVPNMVWYNYRRIPAVTLAKQLIDEGKLGRIFHYRAKFLQDWTISPDLPQGGTGLWRLDVAAAGNGVTDGDHPYMGKWWVPGLQIGYEHSFVHQVADFLEGVSKGQPAQPDFRNAYQTQLVVDAVLQSAQSSKWMQVQRG